MREQTRIELIMLTVTILLLTTGFAIADINYPSANPNSPFGFHPAKVAKYGYPDNGHVDAANIGVGWTREGTYAFWFLVQPDLESSDYDFSRYDRQWGDIPVNMRILGNIAPQGGRIDEGRCLPDSYFPIDEDKYVAFVKATVERYDGDGIDDMPGLINPIKYWQVGNEPSVLNKSGFADLQRITYLAIKDACPDCTVLIAGPHGYCKSSGYVSSFNDQFKPILVDLAGQYVDVMDFHWYGRADGRYRLKDWGGTGQDVVDYIRNVLISNGFDPDLPIWITEMGSYSGDPTLVPDDHPFQTERQQALDYFKRFIYPLSRGVKKVFPAFGLMEGFKHDDGYFDHTGLIYDGEFAYDLGLGVKKLSYYTYKKMTEKLEGADWPAITTLRDGTESDHLYLFRVEKDGQPIHIAWWDYFDEPGYNQGDTKPITLTGLTGTAVTVTEVVPDCDTGSQVSDYNTAFAATTYPVSGHSVIIELGENPVLVTVVGDEPDNLLSNSGFEQGSGFGPDDWTTFPLEGEAIYTWDDTYSNSGDYSVRIDIEGSGLGMCQQTVDVSAGTVYVFTGYVAFEDIISPGHCNLQIVFRNADNQILQFVDLPSHDGARPFELDFPYNLKIRAPDGAVFAEINCFLQGPGTAWFDDIYFASAPAGNIAGAVTCNGQPVQGVRIHILGDPWGQVCEDYTDEFGRYVLEDIPVAFPRYILMAEKDGYKSRPAGDIKIIASQTVTVDFELTAGVNPISDLRVKYGTLELNYHKTPYQVPFNAVIPQDASGYPIEIQPFLASDRYITSEDPEIIALAQQILDSLAPGDRTNTREVVWAVYEWIIKAINHDAVFTYAVHDDVTTGIYQTIRGGWCWGHNFYDWAYKPTETLEYKCAICVEHSWLASAVLRALNIPARAQIGSAQFWVQKPGEYGYWISNLSTSGGSNSYREHGILGSGFGGGDIPAFLPVTSEPFLQEDFGTQNKCLWRETHPWTVNYPGTEQGLNQALNDMNVFKQTGNAPGGQGGAPGSDRYVIRYSDITVNLYNIGTQRILDTRFPIVSESESHHDMQRQAFWTNHPECITRTWIEEITNPPAVGVQRWFHIEFDLTDLVGPLDFNNDDICNLVDFAAFTQNWRQVGGLAPADLNGDHIVNIADLIIFAEHWLN